MTTALDPILTVGTFGVHVIRNPAGSYSFVGEVPVELYGCTYATRGEGESAFVAWFRSQPADFQRTHVGNLRTDAFLAVLAGGAR